MNQTINTPSFNLVEALKRTLTLSLLFCAYCFIPVMSLAEELPDDYDECIAEWIDQVFTLQDLEIQMKQIESDSAYNLKLLTDELNTLKAKNFTSETTKDYRSNLLKNINTKTKQVKAALPSLLRKARQRRGDVKFKLQLETIFGRLNTVIAESGQFDLSLPKEQ